MYTLEIPSLRFKLKEIEVAKQRKVATNETYGVLPPAEVVEDTDDEEDDE